jgi:hypothetical protein
VENPQGKEARSSSLEVLGVTQKIIESMNAGLFTKVVTIVQLDNFNLHFTLSLTGQNRPCGSS